VSFGRRLLAAVLLVAAIIFVGNMLNGCASPGRPGGAACPAEPIGGDCASGVCSNGFCTHEPHPWRNAGVIFVTCFGVGYLTGSLMVKWKWRRW
jgi:hypothetical protein